MTNLVDMDITYEIRNLSITYPGTKTSAVKNFNCSIHRNEAVGILGESGSGKTSIALAMLGLREDAQCSGELLLHGQSMMDQGHSSWEEHRWNEIAIVFQNALNVLNPSLKIIYQITEPLVKHLGLSKEEAVKRASDLLIEVGLDHVWWHAKPSQLSGGMRQKVLIAMALACNPKLLILDEPTMSLDTQSKKQVVSLIRRLKKRHHFSLLVISHEMKLIKQLCDRVHVLYDGYQVEFGNTEKILNAPEHPYTKGLMTSSWELDGHKDIWGIPHKIRTSSENGCPFYNRCFQAREGCRNYTPSIDVSKFHSVGCVRGGIATLMTAKNINREFTVGKVKIGAVKDVTAHVKEGEILALVGHSGSGKSTLASILAGLESYEGEIKFDLDQIENIKDRGGVQLITQDPSASMNLNWTIKDIVTEPVRHRYKMSSVELSEIAKECLEKVHLPNDMKFLSRRAKELSGGQRQRVSIARALSMNPKLLIADEISAMLDPSSAANIVRLLKGMQNMHGFAMIYITHDLHLARKISDRVIVMSEGRIVKEGTTREVLCKHGSGMKLDESIGRLEVI